MFDDIRCEHPLPLPEDQGELAGLDWSQETFQTKSLQCFLQQYLVQSDGTLALKPRSFRSHTEDKAGAETGDGKIDPVLEPVSDFTGSVAFGKHLQRVHHDYSVDWEATFFRGKLAEIRLKKWQRHDNAERRQMEAEDAANHARIEKFYRSWFGRWLYTPYAWVVWFLLNRILRRGLGGLHDALARLSHRCLRLESRLTPYGNPVYSRAWKRIFQRMPPD